MDGLKWKIGRVEIYQIVEMEGGELIQSSIKHATPENIKKIDWLYPNFADKDGKFEALVQSFLIKSNDKNILVDTCNGNGKNRPMTPGWGNLNTNYLENLNSTGLSEKDIDIVVSTHLHFDHVGWNTKFNDGKWIPTFPNAKYLFVDKEYEYWKSKPENEIEDDKLAFDDSVTPVINAGISQIVKSDHRVDSNIKLIPTIGHTPGHISILIESRKERAIISGDILHHPCQLAHPEWTMEADTFPDQALKTRKKIIKEIAGTNTLLIGTHFANPAAGKINLINKSYFYKT